MLVTSAVETLRRCVLQLMGWLGREATTAMKRLGCLLSTKWQRPQSEMIGYVRVRMQLAVVRANTLLLRGSRVERARVAPYGLEGVGMGNCNYGRSE